MKHRWATSSGLAASALLVAAVIAEAQTAAPGEPQRARVLRQGETSLPPNPDAYRKPKHDAVLRDGDIVRGTRNIAAAWLSNPTTRYRHTPFETEPHPITLTVSTRDNRVLRYSLPKDSVFEDRTPRLVDIDGSGVDRVVLVRTYERKGAALAILAVRGNELEIVAETPAIGTPHRWLNPAGFADFDGDGRPDIALVVTPHIKGELQFWTLRDEKLERLAEIDDVSNHVNGSRQLRLSAVADFNGDGIADIAVPSQDRRMLRFFTLAGGRLQDLGEARLPAAAAENFEVTAVAGKPAVRVGLAGGRSVVVSPCRDVDGWEMAKDGC